MYFDIAVNFIVNSVTIGSTNKFGGIMKIKSELKLQMVMLGLGIGPLLFGAMGMITFANNISAALVNGFLFGIILSAIVNIIAIKVTK